MNNLFLSYTNILNQLIAEKTNFTNSHKKEYKATLLHNNIKIDCKYIIENLAYNDYISYLKYSIDNIPSMFNECATKKNENATTINITQFCSPIYNLTIYLDNIIINAPYIQIHSNFEFTWDENKNSIIQFEVLSKGNENIISIKES